MPVFVGLLGESRAGSLSLWGFAVVFFDNIFRFAATETGLGFKGEGVLVLWCFPLLPWLFPILRLPRHQLIILNNLIRLLNILISWLNIIIIRIFIHLYALILLLRFLLPSLIWSPTRRWSSWTGTSVVLTRWLTAVELRDLLKVSVPGFPQFGLPGVRRLLLSWPIWRILGLNPFNSGCLAASSFLLLVHLRWNHSRGLNS